MRGMLQRLWQPAVRLGHLSKQYRSPPRLSAIKKIKRGLKKSDMNFTEGLNIAVEGCCHGELDTIYAALQRMEETEGVKIDLLICCGDFQAVRNLDDLECMAVPDKYKNIMSFYKYYNGSKKAPYPTLFIGGNHEAIHYLRELYYGGWVAPDMYFLGYSGVVNFGGVRIAGMSGIYNERHYDMGYYEKLPYNEGTKRSTYHVRSFDVFKLKQIKEKVDVFLSHDWPDCATEWGDKGGLVQRKPFFRKEVQERRLGSPVGTELLNALQPEYYFAAHLHVKFPALIEHEGGRTTRFLALDKCLPHRDFLQILNIPTANGPKEFHYDPEWLSILKSTVSFMSFGQRQFRLPLQRPIDEQKETELIESVRTKLENLKIPRNFVPTAKAYSEEDRGKRRTMPRSDVRNPQTEEFLDLLDIPYNLHYGNQRSIPSSYAEDFFNELDDRHEAEQTLDASLISFDGDDVAP